MGTELERRGHTQLGKLWSSALVRTNDHAIREVHRDYLEAGANVISTATYQAAMPTLRSTGLHRAEAEELLRDAVALAIIERDLYLRHHPGTKRPLVAASIGPYGASQRNGAEYTGNYDVSWKQLLSFHVERLRILAETEADVLAFETIPSLPEAMVLLELISALPHRWAWLSLNCSDECHLADGCELSEVLKAAQDVPNLCAIGVNCIPPSLVTGTLETLVHYASAPIIVYPNASNAWDLVTRKSVDEMAPQTFANESRIWLRAGAQIVGGCCCTTPAHIRALNHYPSIPATAAVL